MKNSLEAKNRSEREHINSRKLEVAANLKAARRARDMSAKQLSDSLRETGITLSPSAIYNFENARNYINSTFASALAKVLNVEVALLDASMPACSFTDAELLKRHVDEIAKQKLWGLEERYGHPHSSLPGESESADLKVILIVKNKKGETIRERLWTLLFKDDTCQIRSLLGSYPDAFGIRDPSGSLLEGEQNVFDARDVVVKLPENFDHSDTLTTIQINENFKIQELISSAEQTEEKTEKEES